MQKATKEGNSPDDSRRLLRSILKFMKDSQGLSLSELIKIYSESEKDHAIPVSIFAGVLSPSESVCKYLKENRHLSFHDIAAMLERDDRSIWTSYSRASGKMKTPFVIEDQDIVIPSQIFRDRSKSILENVVYFLKANYSFSNSKIAGLLNKHPSAIATVAKRAENKMGGKEKEVKNARQI